MNFNIIEIEKKNSKILVGIILDETDLTVKKFYPDFYLSEIREILKKRITNEFYFSYKNGEKISNKQEQFLILSEILLDNKLYLKTKDESTIKILLNNQFITPININSNLFLSELRDKLNLSKDCFFTYKKTKIDFEEEKNEFKINDIISNKIIEIISYSNNYFNQEIKNKNLNLYSNLINFNSNIIKHENEINLITNEIFKLLYKEVIEIKMLYQGSKDGDNYDIFSNKCFDKLNIIILIKDNNGKKFGVFLKESLEEKIGKGKIKSDPNSFYFSFDLKTIHYSNNINCAIKISDYLIDVEGFSIYKNYFSHIENGKYVSGKLYKNYLYESFRDSDFEYFQICELEVLQLILNNNYNNNYNFFTIDYTFDSENYRINNETENLKNEDNDFNNLKKNF